LYDLTFFYVWNMCSSVLPLLCLSNLNKNYVLIEITHPTMSSPLVEMEYQKIELNRKNNILIVLRK